MATVAQCRKAVDQLVAMLSSVSPELRDKHVPERTVACRLADLDRWFVCELDSDGVHNVVETKAADEPEADVRVVMTSDQLVALANGEDEFLYAWLRGRVQVSASMRDLLRLRALFGL
jgi:hypothetical protein